MLNNTFNIRLPSFLAITFGVMKLSLYSGSFTPCNSCLHITLACFLQVTSHVRHSCIFSTPFHTIPYIRTPFLGSANYTLLSNKCHLRNSVFCWSCVQIKEFISDGYIGVICFLVLTRVCCMKIPRGGALPFRAMYSWPWLRITYAQSNLQFACWNVQYSVQGRIYHSCGNLSLDYWHLI